MQPSISSCKGLFIFKKFSNSRPYFMTYKASIRHVSTYWMHFSYWFQIESQYSRNFRSFGAVVCSCTPARVPSVKFWNPHQIPFPHSGIVKDVDTLQFQGIDVITFVWGLCKWRDLREGGREETTCNSSVYTRGRKYHTIYIGMKC